MNAATDRGNAMATATAPAAWLQTAAHNGHPTPADLTKHVQTASASIPAPTNVHPVTANAMAMVTRLAAIMIPIPVPNGQASTAALGAKPVPTGNA